MARKPKLRKGKRSKFVRDSIGRFARTAGEAVSAAAKAAMKEGADELATVAKENARRAVRLAEDEFRNAARNWKAERKASEGSDEDYEAAQKRYKDAIRARAKARADLANLK